MRKSSLAASSSAGKESNILKHSFLATVLLYALTAFHHYYGAIIYHTPWRTHVVGLGGGVLLLSYLCMVLHRRVHKRVLLILYLLLTFIVFGLGIGIFEGGYNHLVKNILFFSGAKMNTLRWMYPSPAYEMPDNFMFETTGILQFFVGIVEIYYLKRVFKTMREEGEYVRVT